MHIVCAVDGDCITSILQSLTWLQTLHQIYYNVLSGFSNQWVEDHFSHPLDWSSSASLQCGGAQGCGVNTEMCAQHGLSWTAHIQKHTAVDVRAHCSITCRKLPILLGAPYLMIGGEGGLFLWTWLQIPYLISQFDLSLCQSCVLSFSRCWSLFYNTNARIHKCHCLGVDYSALCIIWSGLAK